LSETSNFVRYLANPIRDEVSAVLARIIETGEEFYVQSRRTTTRPEYNRLGITDVTLLMMAVTGAVLLTDDLELYLAASYLKLKAVNYNHIRQARPDFR
jgi:hypothetical protein